MYVHLLFACSACAEDRPHVRSMYTAASRDGKHIVEKISLMKKNDIEEYRKAVLEYRTERLVGAVSCMGYGVCVVSCNC